MKNTVSIPTRFGSRARVLTGCAVLALSTVALGQADRPDRQSRPSTDRPATSNMHNTDDQQTFEGNLVSLFHALNGDESSSTDPLKLNRQSGSHTEPGNATQPQPANAAQQGIPGASTRPSSATQPGIANRSQGQAGLPGHSDTTSAQPGLDSSPSSMGAMPVGQPMALITDSGMGSRTTERSRSTGEGRLSTPPIGSTSASTSQRSTVTTGSPSAMGTTQGGDMYVLVFDPSDPASRSAYLMAQAIVRTDARVTPGTVGATSGTAGRISSETNREQGAQTDATRSMSGMASGTGEKVKITGRVIERDGIQAIAVQKVERQYEDSTASVSPAPGN